LLDLETSHARVFQSSLKTGRSAVRVVHVESSQRSHGDEAEDGRVYAMCYIGLFYSNIVVFVVLGHKGTLVISFPINRTSCAGGVVSIHPFLFHPLAIVAF
jgi:hypothetical protein